MQADRTSWIARIPALPVRRSWAVTTLGVAILGSKQPSTRMLLDASGGSGTDDATIVGTDSHTSVAVAALVNAYAAHVPDYDHSQYDCGTHMSAPVLPAALAIAEMCHRSGKDLLTGYVAGFELGCRSGRVCRFGNYLQGHGIHPTSFLGHFGAAAAAAKLTVPPEYPMNYYWVRGARRARRSELLTTVDATPLRNSHGGDLPFSVRPR